VNGKETHKEVMFDNALKTFRQLEKERIYWTRRQNNRFLENFTPRNQLKQNARSIIISRYEQKMVWESLLEEY